MKELMGILFGLACIIGAFVFFFNVFSKEEIKYRTEPVMQTAFENPVFQDEEIRKVLSELDVKSVKAFLFQQDSQTKLYYPLYIGTAGKGEEALKKQFPDAKEIIPGRVPRTVTVLKYTGKKAENIFTGMRTNNWTIEYSGNSVIVVFQPESTNVFLDQGQMKHFLGRYLQQNP